MDKDLYDEIDDIVDEAWVLFDLKHKPLTPSSVAFIRNTDRTYFIGRVGQTKVVNNNNYVVPLMRGRENHYRMLVITDFTRHRLGKIFYFISKLEDEKEVWDLAGFTLIDSYSDGDYSYSTTMDHCAKLTPAGVYEPVRTDKFIKHMRDMVEHPYVDITFSNQGLDILKDFGTIAIKLLLAAKKTIKYEDLLLPESKLIKMLKTEATNSNLLLSSVEVDRLFRFMEMFFVESNTRVFFLETCDTLGIIKPFFEFARADHVNGSKEMEHALSRYGLMARRSGEELNRINPELRSKIDFKTLGLLVELFEDIGVYDPSKYKYNKNNLIYVLNNLDKITVFTFNGIIAHLSDIAKKDGIEKCIKAIDIYSKAEKATA